MRRLLSISFAPLAESAVHQVVKYTKYLPRQGREVIVLMALRQVTGHA